MQFSQEDKAWIDSNLEIKLGEELGFGAVGRVYALENNPELCIKVPLKFIPQSYTWSKNSNRGRLFRPGLT